MSENTVDRPDDAARRADLAAVFAACKATRTYHGRAIGFFVFLAVFCAVVSYLRDLLWLAAISVVFFGGFAVFIYWWKRRDDPSHSPVLAAVQHRPEEIASVTHRETSDSAGMFPAQWLLIKTRDGKRQSIKVPPGRIAPLAETLGRLCPDADIDVPGFRRPPGSIPAEPGTSGTS